MINLRIFFLSGHVFLNDSMEMLWNALKTSNTIPSACLQNIPTRSGGIPVEPFVEVIRAKFTFLEVFYLPPSCLMVLLIEFYY